MRWEVLKSSTFGMFSCSVAWPIQHWVLHLMLNILPWHVTYDQNELKFSNHQCCTLYDITELNMQTLTEHCEQQCYKSTMCCVKRHQVLINGLSTNISFSTISQSGCYLMSQQWDVDIGHNQSYTIVDTQKYSCHSSQPTLINTGQKTYNLHAKICRHSLVWGKPNGPPNTFSQQVVTPWPLNELCTILSMLMFLAEPASTDGKAKWHTKCTLDK
jgi:hypothetical protein